MAAGLARKAGEVPELAQFGPGKSGLAHCTEIRSAFRPGPRCSTTTEGIKSLAEIAADVVGKSASHRPRHLPAPRGLALLLCARDDHRKAGSFSVETRGLAFDNIQTKICARLYHRVPVLPFTPLPRQFRPSGCAGWAETGSPRAFIVSLENAVCTNSYGDLSTGRSGSPHIHIYKDPYRQRSLKRK